MSKTIFTLLAGFRKNVKFIIYFTTGEEQKKKNAKQTHRFQSLRCFFPCSFPSHFFLYAIVASLQCLLPLFVCIPTLTGLYHKHKCSSKRHILSCQTCIVYFAAWCSVARVMELWCLSI